jgi:predicted negative regulator of RcsB-dependent stress response
MARKKRLQEVKEIPEVKPPEPVSYQDPFQAKVNKQLDHFGKQVEGKGKTILYAVGAIIVAAILIGIIYSWSRRSNNTAQVALSNAIETSIAPVTTQPIPPEYKGKAFKTERERAQAAVDEFQAVAEKYGSPVREKAQYLAAVNRISIDRPAAIQELENLAKNPGEVGSLAKFALAQAKQGDNKLDEAAALYQDLANAKDSVVAKDTINFELASIYEKQGKKAEAIEAYFNIAKKASEAKDSEGKAIPLSQTAREAKDKLKTLDPAKAAEIKEETPAAPDLN